jgi:hypothetical protein
LNVLIPYETLLLVPCWLEQHKLSKAIFQRWLKTDI